MLEPENNTNEEWRPVVGFEGTYSVSSDGRVRRETHGPGTFPGRILRLGLTCYGYHLVVLCLNGTRKDYFVHRLVAAAFIGACPNGYQVNHKDGRKTHNVPSNLEYVTFRENIAHATAMGLMATGDNNSARLYPGRIARGDRHQRAKLTGNKVREIRAIYATGTRNIKELAADFGVCDDTISSVLHHRSWKHIT